MRRALTGWSASIAAALGSIKTRGGGRAVTSAFVRQVAEAAMKPRPVSASVTRRPNQRCLLGRESGVSSTQGDTGELKSCS
jgi:hypothetical protein